MRFALVLVCLAFAASAANAQYRVTNRCGPQFTVTNKCQPAAASCVCGTGCSCAAGTCPACPTATSAGAVRTASGRLIRQAATGWVYADDAPASVAPVYSAPLADLAIGTCSGGSCGVPTAVGRGYARGFGRR